MSGKSSNNVINASEPLWMLAELNTELTQTPDLPSLSRLLSRRLRWLFEFERCTVAVILPSSNHYYLVDITSPTALTSEVASFELSSDTLVSKVLLTDKPYYTPNEAGKLNTNRFLAESESNLIGSLMLLPLRYQGHTIGSLNFYSREDGIYKSSHKHLANLLAGTLGGTLGTLLAKLPAPAPSPLPAEKTVPTPANRSYSNASEALLTLELARAIENGELRLFYQPQYSSRTGKLAGVEALIRWQHPRFGLLPPARFIGLAERTGLIVKLGEWAILEACRQNQKWQQKGYGYFRVAVNVTADELNRPDFVPYIHGVLQETGLASEYLELELTESQMLANYEDSAAQLDLLRKTGIKLAIDDFGTGYSSLSHLHRLGVDTLKIDRSFISDIGKNSSVAGGNSSVTPKLLDEVVTPGQVIVQSVVQLAHGLGLEVVAEGVETEVQKDYLTKLGCQYLQGYLFSPPVPSHKLEELLVTFKPEMSLSELV